METHTESSPNWREWGELRTIRIIDAVILSIGICPKWLEETNQRNPGHPVFKEIDIEASHRAKVSIERAGDFYRWAALTRENERPEVKVNIADYVKWAVSTMKWDVPQELAALAHDKNSLGETTIPVEVVSQANIATKENKLATKKTNVLTSVINIAKEQAFDSSSANDVWNELVKLAKIRQTPLMEFVDGDGIKYQDFNEVKFYTLKNLRDKLARDKKK